MALGVGGGAGRSHGFWMGIPMDFPWKSMEIYGNLWYFHENPWISHGFPMDFPSENADLWEHQVCNKVMFYAMETSDVADKHDFQH